MIIIASEVPFVGDDTETIREKAEKVDFLKDHWPYNLADLVRILDICWLLPSTLCYRGLGPEKKISTEFFLHAAKQLRH